MQRPGPSPGEQVQDRPDSFPKHSTAFYFNLLAAQMGINSGDWTKARDFYHNALKQAPDSAYIMLQLSKLSMLLKDQDSAEEYCRQALQHDPYFIDARLFLARILGRRNKTEEAIAEYTLLLAEKPDDEETLTDLAALYAQDKQTEKALDVIKKILTVNPNSAIAYFHKGSINADQKDTEAAEAAYKQSIKINPGFMQARINLAGLYEKAGNTDLAIRTYREITILMPGHRPVQAKLAYLYIKNGDIDAALSQYQQLLATAPQFDEDIALKIGLIHFEQENFTDAEILFERIIEHNNENQHAQYYLGQTLTRAQQPEKAARAFQAIKPDSDLFPKARIQIAFIHGQSGDFNAAQQVLQEAIKLKPADISLYHALAIAQAENKDYQGAILTLQKALEYEPAAEYLLFYLGHLYEKAGQFDESIAAMRTVLSINAQNADALNFIGYLYAERSIHLREAKKLIKKALKIKPDDGYILDSLGWVYFKMERYKKAHTHLERAHRLVPDDPTIAEHLGDVCRKLNRPEDALAYYRKAREKAPDNKTVQQKIQLLEQKP